MDSNNTRTYSKLGASATKDDVHSAIKNQDKGIFPGAFCKILPDICGDPLYCSLMHADGAGTKSSLAYLKYSETNDVSVFAGIAQDAIVMNMDDMLCVGATSDFVMSNTIGRNAHRISGDIITAIINGYDKFISNMSNHNVNIIMSGGETADVGDLVSTLIVDSTFFVRMPRTSVINCDNITCEDVIVGLASYGQASYEDSYNAGMGSNGLTAARHLLLSNTYAEKYPESFSSTLDKSQAYTGQYLIGDILPGTNITVGDAILSPTRTYAPVMQEILTNYRSSIHGAIHCTGGGQAKCKNFGKNLHYIKDNLLPIPPLYTAIYKQGSISQHEMYQVFNMGHRLELYCDKSTAQAIINIANKYNITAQIVGHVEESSKNAVTITTPDSQILQY